MTITTLPQSLDVVQAEIARIEAQHGTWTEKRRQLAEELAGHLASVVSALLDALAGQCTPRPRTTGLVLLIPPLHHLESWSLQTFPMPFLTHFA